MEERFVEHFEVDENDCWIWTRSRTNQGYGAFKRAGSRKPQLGHRISWEIHRGLIPDGLLVLHKCDRPACVNPDHLFLGSFKDNTQDMVSKNRHSAKYWPRPPERVARGNAIPLAKLNPGLVLEIRAAFATGESMRSIGRRVGVTHESIRKVVRGKSWTHV